MRILKSNGTFGEEIDTRGTNQAIFPMEAEQAQFIERQNSARRVKAEQERELEAKRQAKIAAEWQRNR